MLAVGNAPSFGKRTVCAFKGKFSGMRGDVARYKEGTSCGVYEMDIGIEALI
jgi:hypothetical protein